MLFLFYLRENKAMAYRSVVGVVPTTDTVELIMPVPAPAEHISAATGPMDSGKRSAAATRILDADADDTDFREILARQESSGTVASLSTTLENIGTPASRSCSRSSDGDSDDAGTGDGVRTREEIAESGFASPSPPISGAVIHGCLRGRCSWLYNKQRAICAGFTVLVVAVVALSTLAIERPTPDAGPPPWAAAVSATARGCVLLNSVR